MTKTAFLSASVQSLKRIGFRSIGAAIVTVLCACTTVETNSTPPQVFTKTQPTPLGLEVSDNLRSMALNASKERWNLIIAGKFEDSFLYLTEASKKGLTSQDYGRRMAALRVRAAEVMDASCDKDVCTVTTKVRMGQVVTRVGEVPQEFPLQERWILVNGKLGLIRR
jgi:hypothetical protein